ncbi:MAG: hypothetical protein IJ001_12165, partial [Oscillospiraceae bacterium]|nr:hypothetical protein [Oscillospiraceae bacterium]
KGMQPMSTEKQYIARISYGKDSLKMLEVIKSRGLPLDRITTTDVWATDTISANLPPMQEFKDRMDQRIWDMYRIQVEHLCALNPDGTKKTYEQMFYHIPKRKNLQSVQVERERERENGPELTLSSQPVHVERERERRFPPGSILGFPDLWNPWCQAGLKRNAHAPSARYHYRLPSQQQVQLVPEAQSTLHGAGSRDGLSPTNLCNGVSISKPGSKHPF